ncbi:hypothetical protein ACFXTH_034131 [Malus domestica]
MERWDRSRFRRELLDGSASASAPTARRWKYDVFLSFRGEDTRKGFTDHLYDILQWRAIKTFKDDQGLERGTFISPELHSAIRESQFAIVVLSPNYASSTWCLSELAMIFQCMTKRGTILPIFYNVDPSDVRHQRGTFAEAFAKHEKEHKENMWLVDRWRASLTNVSNLAGWTSNDRYETELIKEVVEAIWKKVHPTYTLSGSTENLVGIDFRLKYIDMLLFVRANDVRFIGIWGMGGMGKTTLARLVYERISHEFQVISFLANIRERSSKSGLAHLQDQLLSLILKEKTTQVWDVYSGSAMTKNLLSNKKVLLILDDVDELNQLEILAGKTDWFGPGSRIIVTTRNERLLIEHGIDKRYEVLGLNDDQSLHLFSLKAFKTDQPDDDYVELSKCFVDYAGGHPLALKILGSSLYKRGQDAWNSALDKVKKAPNAVIFETLKISYDGLDEMEKKVFLDVACFHTGNDKERVIEILENCGFCARIVIDVLIEKSLLSILDGYVMMHDLTQEMGWEIVRQESYQEPGRRSRLWLHNEIFHIFMKDTGTEAIEGIALRLPELEQAQWNPESFSKICNLKFLQLHNLSLSVGPKYLSNDLRFIDWSWYPSESLPQNFQPDELSELSLHHSKIDRLWSGMKNMSCLKYIDLSHSQNLTATPDFTGIQNLERLVLESCTNLVEIHPSITVLKRLKILNFRNCNGIKSLPSALEMESLEVLVLSGCSKLKRVPEFVGNMKKLSTLSLDGTAIQDVPSSIDHLIGLISLDLKDCKSLLCLPTAICSLKSLKILNLSGCSKLETIPENWEKIECLEELDLSGTAIRDSPSSLFLMKSLKVLSLRGCKGPPLKSWHSFLHFGLFPTKNPDPMGFVLTSLDYLYSLSKLDLSDCNLCEGAIPDDIGCLPSLEDLVLRGNDFVSLPASIRWLDSLKFLNLDSCKSLQELPDLPSNEELTVTTEDCTCLKVLPHPPNISRLRWFFFRAVNCYRLVGNEARNNMIFSMLQQFLQGTPPFVIHSFNIVTPGSEMPEWFNIQRAGDSIVVTLPDDVHPTRSKLKGFALCAVFAPQESPAALEIDSLECHACGIKCLSTVTGSMSGKTSLLVKGVYYHKAGQIQSDHLWLLYLSFKGYDPRNYWKGGFHQIEFSFKTFCSGPETNKCLKLKKCGVRLVKAEDHNNSNNSISLYEPMEDPHCALPESANAESAIHMKQTTEHFDGAGSSGSSSISTKESVNKRLKYD